MNTNVFKGALVALVMVVVGLLGVGPAQATGSPGCWTYGEWANTERGTMSQIEHYAEVVGLGKVVHTQNGGRWVLKQYPVCGKTQREGFVQVFYAQNVAGQYMANYVTWFAFFPRR